MAGTILTNIGLSKLASATPQNQLNITHIAVGDGNGGFPTLSPTMTSLTNEVWRGDSSNPVKDSANTNYVYFETNIPPEVGPFDVREIACFDSDGDMIAIGHTSLIQKPNQTDDASFAIAVKIFIALENTSDFDLIYKNAQVTSHNSLSGLNAVNSHPASAISTTSGVSTQQFIDNFELKIFQSPTDNLTKVSTFAGGVGVVYEVRKTSDNSLATIYSDKDGLNPIVQNGTSNVSDASAECVFYIADGDYYIEVDSVKGNFNASNRNSFETLQDAISSKTLVKGSVITTGGYKSLGDGGHATYAVVSSGSGVADFGSFLDTNSGNQLELLVSGGCYSPEVFGIFLDGETNWEASEFNRLKAMLLFGVNNKLTTKWPAGQFASSINLTPEFSGMRWHCEDGFEMWGIPHIIGSDANARLSDVRITGTLTTYDRLGIQFSDDIYVERAILKSDPSKNVVNIGSKGRGLHISEQNDGITIDYLEIDDCTNTNNTDAAIAIDGVVAPSNVKIGYAWIKDSDTHGVYMQGDGHVIDTLRIDAWCELVPTRSPIQTEPAQELIGKAVWLNRVWDGKIGTMIINQVNAGATRGNAQKCVLFDQTGSPAVTGSTEKPFVVDTIILNNVAREGGVYFGDPVSLSPNNNVKVGSIFASFESGKTLNDPLNQAVVWCDNVKGQVDIDLIDFRNTENQPAFRAKSGSNVYLGRLYTTTKAEAFRAEGLINCDSVRVEMPSGSSTSTSFRLRGVGANGSKVGNVHISASAQVNTKAIEIENIDRWEVGKILTENMVNTLNNVKFSVVQRGRVGGLDLVGVANVGVGVNFTTCVECSFENGRITGFEKGTTGSGFTRTNAINLHSIGNTTATDITTGSIAELNCTYIQL